MATRFRELEGANDKGQLMPEPLIAKLGLYRHLLRPPAAEQRKATRGGDHGW